MVRDRDVLPIERQHSFFAQQILVSAVQFLRRGAIICLSYQWAANVCRFLWARLCLSDESWRFLKHSINPKTNLENRIGLRSTLGTENLKLLDFS